jgi:DNA-binding CsgD family transcriptional regulator
MAVTGSADSASGTPSLQWPLVGRLEQLELFTATLADDRAHGFVIYGMAGVGKTRLADQCLAVASRAGRNVARATATEGSQSVPLGALAHLLPAELADERRDHVAVVAEVRALLQTRATDGPLVLFVDDFHLLDHTSATLVGQLVDADLVFLVATVRTNASVPPGLDSLWQRARVRRIDLPDLDRAAVDTLLHLVLHGPVEATTTAEIWGASQGNMLFVRELVLGALDSERLVHQRGVWRLVGPLVTTARLHELVATRLGSLEKAATDALDILAVWEPAGLVTLEAIVADGLLEMLDRSGLLAVRADRRRQQVTLAHPLYGEILRARMPALTRRRLLLEHADRIDALGARRREDAVRVATARLEASGTADPALLLRAARLARYGHDFTQVERLGRAAIADGMTAEAGLLVGEALHEHHAFAEADKVLTAAEAVADEAEILVLIAEMRARNFMWGLFRHDEALKVNASTLDRLSDPGCIEEITLHEAFLLAYAGQPANALAALPPLPDQPTMRLRALHALAELPALIATGKCETAVVGARQAFSEQIELPDPMALPGPGVHVINQIYALSECGRLEEASKVAAYAYDATPANAPPDGLMWLSHQQGRCALLMGRLETATRWLAEAAARCEEWNIVGPRRLVLSSLATAQAGLGDAAATAATVVELERLQPFPFVQAEQELGRAWGRVVAGDLPGARDVLRAAAELAAECGYRVTEAWLLHDIARLGDPGSVAARLAELAAACEGVLVPAYAAHAAAAASGRAAALVEATDNFERIGAMLMAAEAATEAAQAFQRAGDRRASAALGVRASNLAGSCEGARTPGLSAPVMVVPLTPRERDIATLAASGESSKDIADRLFLSVRTVNNHLQNVYSKLGVSGRRQLASALAELTDVSS